MMPIHDWTRVDAGVFHHFHHQWISAISDALNGGTLPPGYFALAEQVLAGPIPDVVTLQHQPAPQGAAPAPAGGVAIATAPPRARYVVSAVEDIYARRANRIAIRHELGRVVAVIEIVSPGNKSSQYALRAFVAKAYELISQGINLLVVDLFPPTARDPRGIHQAIWSEITSDQFDPPPDKPLTVAAYCADELKTAYVEPVAVGDLLPPLPLFLDPAHYVPAPLEETYNETWRKVPAVVKALIEGGREYRLAAR